MKNKLIEKNTDEFIGKKIRLRRVQNGLSQDEIGKLLGITFQQFQKYENGINRVPSSRLYEIAKILKVPISYFFDGIGEIEEIETNVSFNKDILKMNKLFSKLKCEKIRKSLINIVKCLVEKKEMEENEHN